MRRRQASAHGRRAGSKTQGGAAGAEGRREGAARVGAGRAGQGRRPGAGEEHVRVRRFPKPEERVGGANRGSDGGQTGERPALSWSCATLLLLESLSLFLRLWPCL